MLKFMVKDDPEHAPENLVEIEDLAERRDLYRHKYNKSPLPIRSYYLISSANDLQDGHPREPNWATKALIGT